MDSEVCVICLTTNSEHLVSVGKKGIQTLLKYSKIHKDEKLDKLFSECLTVKVHATCRRDFTNDRRISLPVVIPEKKIKLRSQVFPFKYVMVIFLLGTVTQINSG